MDLWLPGYEHRPVHGAGLSVTPGAAKVGSHTTETPRGSFDALERHWRNNWGAGLPHFLQEGARIVQFLPLNVGAYTAKNRPGGADINRSGPMIQIETISRAAQGWDDETYEAFGTWLADLKRNGLDFDIDTHPRFYGANEGIVLAREDSPIRLSAAEFEAFNGWLGHQHFPENDHWDPGGIDADRVVRIAHAHLGDQGDAPIIPTPPPTSEEDDDMLKAPRKSWRTEAGEWFALRPDGEFAYINGGETLKALQTPAEGQPAEILAPIEIKDRGVANTLAQFYNGRRLDPEPA
jgi:hypothetical protein